MLLLISMLIFNAYIHTDIDVEVHIDVDVNDDADASGHANTYASTVTNVDAYVGATADASDNGKFDVDVSVEFKVFGDIFYVGTMIEVGAER